MDECEAEAPLFIQLTIRDPDRPEMEMLKQVVEYAGVPVGILVPQGDRLTFLAVKFHVMGLDGRRFRSLSAARSAIHSHVTRGDVLVA